jgi:YVTN family beta-propeller protein
VEYRILGPLEIWSDGRQVSIGGGHRRDLLALLLLHAGEAVSRRRLIDGLWGENAPDSADKVVQNHVSALRRSLPPHALVTRGRSYQLELDGDALDLRRFEALRDEGRRELASGSAEAAARLLREALALWRGDAFSDCELDRVSRAEAAALDDARLATVEERVDADLAAGRHRDVVGELESLVARHPYRERFWEQLMVALNRSGRPAEALATYRRAREVMTEELGMEPGAPLRALERAILTQEPSLAAPQRIAHTETASEPARRGRRQLVAVLVAMLAVVAAALALALGRGGPVAGAVATPNSVAVIDPASNRVVGVIAVGARPGPVAFGAGSLWVANRDDRTIARVAPAGRTIERTIALREEPTGIAAEGRSVWVVAARPLAPAVSVDRIDTRYDTIRQTKRLGNVVLGGDGAVAVSRKAVWVAPSSGLLTRLDSRTGRVVRRLDPNASPAGIAAGAGALWLVGGAADTVTRVDPTGLLTPIPVGRDPVAAVVGAGAVWVVDALDDTVVRIDPKTWAVRATIAVGRRPGGVAAGLGSIWVANAGDGTVSRIDPSTNRRIATIPVGGSPQSLVVGAKKVWVTVDAALPEGPPRGGTLRIESLPDIQQMDPALVYEPRAWVALSAVCATLVHYASERAPGGSRLEPEVAESLPSVSTDRRTYTFTIRPGFHFSSGEPVTARTFRYAIERSLSKRMNGPARGYLGDVAGAREFMAGRSPHLAGVTADGRTLTVRLVAPAPDLPARLAMPYFCAVPVGTPLDPRGVRTLPGAGPYRLAAFAPGQGAVLLRNLYYRGARPHSVDRIVLIDGVTPRRQVADVEAGTADVALDVPREDYRRFPRLSRMRSASGPRLSVNAFPQLDLLVLNTHRAAFEDVRLRRAVNYAIDRTTLARLGDPFSLSPGTPTDQYLPPDLPGFRDVHIYPFHPDVARARQLAGGHRKTVVFYTCNQSPCDRMAQVVTTNLAAIGLNVQTRTFALNELFTRMVRKGEPFDIAWTGWVADYPDPDDFLNLLLESGNALPSFDDPVWKRRLARAAELTGPERYLTYGTLDVALARSAAPWVAIGNRPTVTLLAQRVGCASDQTVYGLDLDALCLRPARPSS